MVGKEVAKDEAKKGKLGIEVTVDASGRTLVITRIHEDGPAARDGRLKIGDSVISVKQLSPEAWIETHGGTATPAKLPKQALDSILEALKSEGQGAWVVEVMRRGFDDVIEVEIASNGSVAAQGQRGGGQQDPFGIAALQKNLLAQLVQASAPKADWQTKAARVGMPGFGGEFKEHVWSTPHKEEVWEGPDDEPEEDKLRDPETGLLLEYSHYGTSSPAPRNNHARIGRLPLILAGLGSIGTLCLICHLVPIIMPSWFFKALT